MLTLKNQMQYWLLRYLNVLYFCKRETKGYILDEICDTNQMCQMHCLTNPYETLHVNQSVWRA